MKRVYPLCFSLLAIALTSCGNPGALGKSQEAVVGPNGYELTGKNDDGSTCTTGVKNFSSQHLMCLNIQDSAQNNNCAQNARIEKFVKECIPQGYTFLESQTCSVIQLTPEAQVNRAFGDYEAKDVLQKKDYCVGYKSDGSRVDSLRETQAALGNNRFLNLSLTFATRADLDAGETTKFQAEIFRGGAGYKQAVELEADFNLVGNIVTAKSALSGDGRVKYLVRCAPIAVCDGK